MTVHIAMYTCVRLSMPKPPELSEEAVLLCTFPGAHLWAGDGAVLEVFSAINESIAVVTVPWSAVAPLHADQVPAVRRLAAA